VSPVSSQDGPGAASLALAERGARGPRGPYRASAATLARRATARERLIAAATEIVAREGYRGLTIAGAAARAGLAVGSVYRHFDSKAELETEVFRRQAEHELTAVRRAAGLPDEPLAALRDAVATFAARALASPCLAWALLAEPVGAEVEAERLRFRRSYRELFGSMIELAIAAGQLPADQRPALTAAAVVGAVSESLIGPLAPADAGDGDAAGLVERITWLVVRLCGGQP
jgi:AcrR family transcriptional regulator